MKCSFLQLLLEKLLFFNAHKLEAYMTVTDETQLIDRLLKGEERAYKEIMLTYQNAMRAAAYAIVGSRNADEVVQDAWLLVVRNLDGFQKRSSLKTWLITITSNLAKDRYKKNRREVLMNDLTSPSRVINDYGFSGGSDHWLAAPLAWHQDTPDAILTKDELLACIEQTLLSLPELQSSVLLLRDRLGLEQKEICNLLEISPSNARVLLHRARLKIYATVEYFEETGECLSSKDFS
jgi:RNA polymerase sigma-70 factor (ECF subfamily)